MSVTSNRSVTIEWTGSVEYSQTFTAPVVSTGSGQIDYKTLSSGNNAIVVPPNAVGMTIIPPEDNTVVLTLKGVNGDTGILLAVNAPSSIGLDGSGTDLVLNAASTVTVRIIFS